VKGVVSVIGSDADGAAEESDPLPEDAVGACVVARGANEGASAGAGCVGGGEDGAGCAKGGATALEGAAEGAEGALPEGDEDGAVTGALGGAGSPFGGAACTPPAQSPITMAMRRTKDGAIPSTYTGRRQ
jgi:hypothetical protein